MATLSSAADLAGLVHSQEGTASPDALWASAMLDLAFADSAPGILDRVIGRLREVIAGDSANALALNDLAVALSGRSRSESPRDLFAALEAIERAFRLQGDLPVIRFNRALAFQRLFLVGEAAQAWRDYLQVDSTSAWSAEARANLIILAQWEATPSARARLDKALAQGRNLVALADTVARDEPEGLRDFITDVILPSWAIADRSLGSDSASALLRTARSLAEVLARTTTDSAPLVGVITIERQRGTNRFHFDSVIVAYAQGQELFHRGNYAQARKAFQTGLNGLAFSMEDSGRLALLGPMLVLHAATEIYEGTLVDAVALHRDILRRLQGRSLTSLEARAHWGLAISLFRLGKLDEAIESYHSAILGFQQVSAEASEGAMRAQLAECFARTGEDDRALTSALLAQALLRRHRSLTTLHNSVGALAVLLEELGLPVAANAVDREAVRVASRTGRPKDPVEAATRLSHSEALLHRWGEARLALAAARQGRVAVTDPAMQSRLDIELAISSAAIHMSGDPHRAAEELARVARYYREQGFIANLVPTLSALASAYLSGRDTSRAETTFAEAVALVTDRSTSQLDRWSQAQLLQARGELFRHLIGLRLARGDTVEAFRSSEMGRPNVGGVLAQPKSLAEIASRLALDQAAIGYSVLPTRLVIWLGTRAGILVQTVDISADQLGQLVSRFVNAIRVVDDSLARNAVARRLYDVLLAPVRDRIADKRELTLVTDLQIAAVPFAALQDPTTGRFLIETYRLRFVPTLSSVASPRSVSAKRSTTLIVDGSGFEPTRFPGLGPLTNAREEIADLLAARPSARVAQGSNATVSAVIPVLGKYDLVHFVGHARSVGGDPELSYLVLGPATDATGGDILPGSAIRTLNLSHVSLVVLSSCGTVARADATMKPISGLAQAFFGAGVAAVISSLWEADDAATRVLMREFHRALLQIHDPAEALRRAQLKVLADEGPRLRGPATWAGFRFESAGLRETEVPGPSNL